MKLPRDLSGQRLATLLEQFSYEPVRQTGSHLRLATTLKGTEHRITIPMSRALPVGTLSTILGEVAAYLDIDKSDLADKLFN